MYTRNHWLYSAAVAAGKQSTLKDSRGKQLLLITTDGTADENTSYYNSSTGYTSYMGYSVNATDIDRVRNAGESTVGTVENGSSSMLFDAYGVMFGSGNEPATVDDYKFSGDPISGCTFSCTVDHTFAEDGSESVISATYTITNNNDADITIGEIGYFNEALVKKSSNTYRHVAYLYERTALESPITIPAGGVGQVEYTIRMNYPVSVTTE